MLHFVGRVAVETAAGNWFTRLPVRTQRVYLHAHPGSKFNDLGIAHPAEHDHSAWAAHHRQMKAFHEDMSAAQRYGDPVHDDAARKHSTALQLREKQNADLAQLMQRTTRAANLATKNTIFNDRETAPARGGKTSAPRESAPSTSLPFGHVVPKGEFKKHARMMGAVVPKGTPDNMREWRGTIGRAAAAGTVDERRRHTDAANALLGNGGGKSSVGESLTDLPAIVDPLAPARSRTVLPTSKGVRIADNGIELRPIEHPEPYAVHDGKQSIGGKMMTAHSFEVHKNGVRIGTVHSTEHSVDHMIPNSRLRSHTSHHRVYKLNIDPRQLRAGAYAGRHHASLKSAVDHANSITLGTSTPKTTSRMVDVDHAAHIAEHEKAADLLRRIGEPLRYSSPKRNPIDYKHFQRINSARWMHSAALEAHRRAASAQGSDRYDELLRHAVNTTSQAKRKSNALNVPFEPTSRSSETAASDWFARLDPASQEAYRRAHPGSRYGHAPLPRHDHAGHIRHHDHMIRFHSNAAHADREDLDEPKYGSHAHAVALHQMASSRHLRALNDAGNAHELRVAHSMSHEANERSRRILNPRPGKA